MANPKTARKHAIQRLKSRQGVKSPHEVETIVKEVLEHGTKIKDLPEGELKDALFRKYHSNTQRKRTYYYKDNIYIFSKENVLITTYTLQLRRKYYVD